MRILYVITKSNWGGAQKYVFDLATHMQKSGHEIVVAHGGYGLLYQRLREAGIKTRHIHNLERNINPLKEFRVIGRLFKIIQEEKPDILHLNSSKIGALGSILGRLLGIEKIIFTAHGWPFREERSVLQIGLIKFISWLTITCSTKTICVSSCDYTDVEVWPWVKNKLVMIHNGIDSSSAKATEDKSDSALLRRDKQENKIIQIISVGELTKNKGFEYALRAISLLKEDFQDFRYTIYSFGGEERWALEKLILYFNLSEYVDLFITNEEHTVPLKESDIFFLASLKEGLPYVLLEAGLNSLAVVASDTGGVREIVENNQNGLLVENKDIFGFKQALFKLIQDKSLRISLGEKNRAIVLEKFNIETMLEQTEAVYLDNL